MKDGKVVSVHVSESSGTVLSVDDALIRAMPQRGAGRYNLFIWDKLFRRSALMKDGFMILFDQAYSYCEDVLWLTQVLLNSKTVVFCDICGYNYRTNNHGNTWTALSNYLSLKHCASAMETNQQVLQLLQEAGSKAENNQLQRILFYQRYAFRTAARSKDSKAYYKYRTGYYPSLLKWYTQNRTLIGLKWLIRQVGSDAFFQMKRMIGDW